MATAGACAGLRGWPRAGASFAAGAASVLALPPFHLVPLLFVTLPVLIWLLDEAPDRGKTQDGSTDNAADRSLRDRFWGGFRVGWWFGFGYFLLGLFWIGEAFLVEAEKFAVLMPFAVIGLTAGLALFFGLMGGVARLFWAEGYGRVAVLAIVWAVAEWVRGNILSGFPWNPLGSVFAVSDATLQLFAWTGMYGASLVAVALFASPALETRRFGQEGQEEPVSAQARWRFLPLLACLLALALIYAAGAMRLPSGPQPTVPGTELRLVQPSVPQRDKWNPAFRDKIYNRLIELSLKPTEAAPSGLTGDTVLIWPEASFPFLMVPDAERIGGIGALLPQGGALVMGAVRMEPAAHRTRVGAQPGADDARLQSRVGRGEGGISSLPSCHQPSYS